jgi:hypothetical protein
MAFPPWRHTGPPDATAYIFLHLTASFCCCQAHTLPLFETKNGAAAKTAAAPQKNTFYTETETQRP